MCTSYVVLTTLETDLWEQSYQQNDDSTPRMQKNPLLDVNSDRHLKM